MSAGRRFCRNGHELTPDNVYEREQQGRNGKTRIQRRCRICKAASNRGGHEKPQPNLERILDLRCRAETEPRRIADELRAEADRLEAGA